MDGIAGKFAPIGEVIRAPYTNTYDLPLRSFQAPLRRGTIRRVATELREIAPDVIHLNKQNLEDGLDLVEATARSGCARVGMIHITQSAVYLKARFAGLRDGIARRMLRRFGGLWVALPDNRFRELRGFVGPGIAVREVPNGVVLPDLQAIRAAGRSVREELGIADQAILVLAVGRVTFQKRPDRFLDVAEKVRDSHPDVRFLWVGAGDWDAEWERQVASRGLGSTVTRVGWQDDVARYYGAADLFLHPAEYEGLPLAVLEALAASLPVALSDRLRRDLRSLGEDTTIALENEPAFRRLLEDPQERGASAARSRHVAESRYSIEAVAKLWESLYTEALSGE